MASDRTDESDRRAFEFNIVNRLRRAAYVMFTDGYHSKDLAEKAAGHIEALERKVVELEEEISRYQGLLDAAIDDYNDLLKKEG
ncbi:hypothetical protein [Rhizobium leguminosarum]